jgi:hypothetical protein
VLPARNFHGAGGAFQDASDQSSLGVPMSHRRTVNGDVDHEAIITSIAQEVHYPIPIVKRIYEDEFARLRAGARATDTVVLFASRRTRERLLSARRQRTA